jgi:hypothetical protein
MNKKPRKALRVAAASVSDVARPFDQFTNGLQMLVDEIPKTPDVAELYKPLLPVLKRLLPLVARAIELLEQPPAGREG